VVSGYPDRKGVPSRWSYRVDVFLFDCSDGGVVGWVETLAESSRACGNSFGVRGTTYQLLWSEAPNFKLVSVGDFFALYLRERALE